MQDKLITLLASQNSYSVGLAHEIGIEGAVAVNEIIKYCGFSKAANDIVHLRFKQAGIKDPLDMVEYLSVRGIISYDGGSTIQLQKPWFEELETLEVTITKSIWQDPNFLVLVKKWKAVLERKGRKKTEAELVEMFRDKDIQAAKEALEYAVNNQLVTLFYRENNRSSVKSNIRDSGSRADRGTGERVFAKPEGGAPPPRTVHKGLQSLD